MPILLQRLIQPGWSGLRMYPRTAALLGLVGGIALAVVLPVALLGDWHRGLTTRLLIPPVPDLGLSPLQGPLHSVSQNRQEALLFSFRLLAGLAALTFTVAAFAALGLGAGRATQRAGETSVRRAVGAARWMLAGAALVEGGAIAMLALVLGGPAGAMASARAQHAWVGGIAAGGVEPVVLVLAATAALLSVALLLPLAYARQLQVSDPASAPIPLWIPSCQLGLSLIALVAGGQLAGSSAALLGRTGNSGEGTLYRITSTESSAEERARHLEHALDRVKGLPQVEVASLAGAGTLLGLGPVDRVTTDCGVCSDGGLMVPWRPVQVTEQLASADTFKAIGARVVAGREFSASDRFGGTPVAMVSENLARRDFQNGEPLGRQIRIRTADTAPGDAGVWYTVIGVVEDRHPAGLGAGLQPAATVYLSVLQHPPASVELLVRGAPGAAPQAAVVDALRTAFPGETTTIEALPAAEVVRQEAARLGWLGTGIRATGWAMLLLAGMGLLVLMRSWVLSLRQTLGIHRAAGARRHHIAALILSRAAGVGLLGAFLGVGFGPAIWDTLPEVIAGTPAWSPSTVAALAVLLTAAAVAGTLGPGWRILRAPPHDLLQENLD